MKIAILGAGFAGFGTAYHLLHHSKGSVTVDLFDPQPIGMGVSGFSSGLFHPYPGRKAEKIANADNYLMHTHQLLTEASKGANKSLVLSKGILRPASTSEQSTSFQKTAEAHPDTQFWDLPECERRFPGLIAPHGGLFIQSGLTLDVPAYLDGLWQLCLRFGLKYHQKLVTKQSELHPFDRVIFAVGANIQRFPFFADLPLQRIKGQALRLEWPHPLPMSLLISDGHLVPCKEPNYYLAGATFERHFTDEKPHPEIAISQIMGKLLPFLPELAKAKIVDCWAGIRAMPERGKGPLLGRVTPEYWYITGLGAKGLLLHGYLTDLLAQAVLQDDPSLLVY